jgi:hypothetical protein
MSVHNPLFEQAEEYMCKISGRTFSTTQSLAAHIDLEHPEAEQPEIFVYELGFIESTQGHKGNMRSS